jgi:hypothetical protein
MKVPQKIGVYETMRSFNGVFALLPEHEARLEKSCKAVSAACGVGHRQGGASEISCPDLESIIAPYEERLRVTSAGEFDLRLKVEVILGGGGLSGGEVRLHEEILPIWTGDFLHDETWKVKFVTGERVNPEIKTLDTSFQTLEREKAAEEGFDEIVMVSPDGFVREGGITNIFFVDGKKLITPASGMLPGIGRHLVIQFAKENGISVEERDVKLSQVEKKEFFLVNSVRGIVPVGRINPVAKKLSKIIGNFINERIKDRKNKICRNS